MKPTPLALEAHRTSQRFHAAIARRASLVPQREDRSYSIPNTPFGVPKIAEPLVVRVIYIGKPENYYDCMWFWELVNFVPLPPEKLSVDKIIKTAARFYGVSKMDLVSSRRTANIVGPRMVAAYLAKTMTARSLPEIGRRIGGRDHTTILHSVRKIEKRIKCDQKLAAEIDEIKRMVSA